LDLKLARATLLSLQCCIQHHIIYLQYANRCLARLLWPSNTIVLKEKFMPQHQMTDEKKDLAAAKMTDEKKEKFMLFSNQNGSLPWRQLGAIGHSPKYHCSVLGCYGGIFTEDVRDVSPLRRYQS